MSLGSDILAAINALSEADKGDISKVWEAAGGEIEIYPGGPSNEIKDNRDAGDVTPDDLPESTIFYTFTDDIAGSPNAWDAVLNVKGWTDTYAAWQLFASSSQDDNDKNLYFRRGRNATWDTLQRILTDVGGTLKGDLTLASGVDILHSGTNADKYIYFASDAYLWWDESANTLKISKKFLPVTGNALDLGSDTFEWKDLWIDGIAYIDQLNMHGDAYWHVNQSAYFGTGSDALPSYILHNDTDFYIRSRHHGGRILLQGENLATGANKNLLIADPDGSLNLYYAGVMSAHTMSGGLAIDGNLSVSGYCGVTGKNPAPIGMMYIQFNGKSAPGDIFVGTWTDRSSTWAGRFFRAMGGAAATPFGTAQDDAFQGHQHTVVNSSDQAVNTQASGGAGTARYVRFWGAGGIYEYARAIGNLSGYGTARVASETRPTNYGVKIYERTS